MPGASSPQQAAEDYLKANHSLFGLKATLSDLRLKKELEMLGSTSFTFTQTHKDLPVLGGQVYVVARRDAVLLASAELVPVTGDFTFPTPTDPGPAIRAVIADVGRRYPKDAPTKTTPASRLVILVRNGMPIPVWEINYETTHDSYQVLVEAATNEVLAGSTTRIFIGYKQLTHGEFRGNRAKPIQSR